MNMDAHILMHFHALSRQDVQLIGRILITQWLEVRDRIPSKSTKNLLEVRDRTSSKSAKYVLQVRSRTSSLYTTYLLEVREYW
jgi:hypothetical protein